MTITLAIDILKALACCSTTTLTCGDCPLWDNKTSKCRPWTTEEVTEAVMVLNKDVYCLIDNLIDDGR